MSVGIENIYQVIGDEEGLKKFHKYYFKVNKDGEDVLYPKKILGKDTAYKFHGQQGYNNPLKTPSGEFLHISTTLDSIEWPGHCLFYHFVEHFPQLKFCYEYHGEGEYFKYFTKIENGKICYGEDGKQIIEEESKDWYMPEWYDEECEARYLGKISEILDTPLNLRRMKILAINNKNRFDL